MDSNNPFLFKWSLKRSPHDTKAPDSSTKRSCNQPPNEEFSSSHQNNDTPVVTDQKDVQNENPQFLGETTNQMQAIQEAMLNHLHISQKSRSPLKDDETVSLDNIKLEKLQSSSSSSMDVDSLSSEKAASDKGQYFNLKEASKELQAVEKKYCQWLSGEWLPSKQDALQLSADSKMLQQRFQEIAKVTERNDEIITIMELSSTLDENIKQSIMKCEARSLEWMDYENCSSGKEGSEQMDTGLSELENEQTCTSNWTPHSNNQTCELEEQGIDREKELNTSGNMKIEKFNPEFQQDNDSVDDNTSFQENASLRAERVRAIRTILIPRVLDMLDNFELWSERHVDKTMQAFLDTKYEEMLREKNSVD